MAASAIGHRRAKTLHPPAEPPGRAAAHKRPRPPITRPTSTSSSSPRPTILSGENELAREHYRQAADRRPHWGWAPHSQLQVDALEQSSPLTPSFPHRPARTTSPLPDDREAARRRGHQYGVHLVSPPIALIGFKEPPSTRPGELKMITPTRATNSPCPPQAALARLGQQSDAVAIIKKVALLPSDNASPELLILIAAASFKPPNFGLEGLPSPLPSEYTTCTPLSSPSPVPPGSSIWNSHPDDGLKCSTRTLPQRDRLLVENQPRPLISNSPAAT